MWNRFKDWLQRNNVIGGAVGRAIGIQSPPPPPPQPIWRSNAPVVGGWVGNAVQQAKPYVQAGWNNAVQNVQRPQVLPPQRPQIRFAKPAMPKPVRLPDPVIRFAKPISNIAKQSFNQTTQKVPFFVNPKRGLNVARDVTRGLGEFGIAGFEETSKLMNPFEAKRSAERVIDYGKSGGRDFKEAVKLAAPRRGLIGEAWGKDTTGNVLAPVSDTKVGKAILGDRPLKTIKGQNQEWTDLGVGAQKAVGMKAKTTDPAQKAIGAGVGLLFGVTDFTSGRAGKKLTKEALEKVAQSQSKNIIKKIVGKVDDITLDKLVKETDPKKIGGILKTSQNIDLPTTPKSKGQTLSSPELPKGSPKTEQVVETSSSLDSNFNVFDYITQQKNAQKLAEGKPSKFRVLKDLGKEVKTKMEDFTHPIEDTLGKAEKEGKFKVLPKADVRIQIDKVLRSDSLASQFIKDRGLADVVRNADNLDELEQYLIAKQARDVVGKGIKTGRDLASDERLIAALSGKYEPLAQQAYKYSHDLLDYTAESGLIKRELAEQLKKEYPNYVPLNRIFSEIEQESMGIPGRSKAVASIGKQGVVSKLKGSEREIQNPLESLVSKTATAFEHGERNKAARMLVSYKDLPSNPFQLREITGAKTPGMATISVFEDGVKKIYETTPEIAAAAKNLNKENISLLGQIFAVPTRVLRLGATGLNLPFVASNVVKDQMFAAINSSKALKTSLANPVAFTKAFMNAVKHGDLYDDWVRSGASFTSWDISRNQVKPTIQKIRSGRSIISKVGYTVSHPREFIRTLEDAIGRSEELTRMQQFEGMKTALLKQGRTLEDANLLAAKASMENTANFARRGEWSTVVNSLVPYINAGIQGARSLRRSILTRPVATAAKLSTLVFMPVAMTTMWNLSDSKRREAYNDIPDFEKENNIIIIPPDPVYDPTTRRWNAVKIPLTPGLTSLGSIVRRQLEGIDGVGNNMKNVSADLFATATSFDISSKNKIMSQWTPQGLKPFIENYTNTNLYTGKNIVPDYMKNLPPEEQVYENTSGTARKIGRFLNMSPLKIENTARTTMGGVGSQLLNASDRLLNKAGLIPEDQIGGKDTIESIKNRFLSASGGEKVNKLEEQSSKTTGSKRKTVYNTPKNAMEKLDLIDSNPEKYRLDVEIAKERGKSDGKGYDPLYNEPIERQNAYLQYQTMPPGSADKKDWYNKNKSWYQPLSEARSSFFDKLPEADPEKKAYIQYPEASPEVERKTEEYNQLPKEKKAGFLKDNPQIIEQWDKQFEYTNKIREARGYAKLKGYPKATPQLQSFIDKYMAADKGTRKAIRNAEPQNYINMSAYFDSTSLYTINKEGALNQLEGNPDQTSKQNKAISNLARDIYKNPDGTYSIVPAGWMQGLENGSGGYGKKKSGLRFSRTKKGRSRLKKGKNQASQSKESKTRQSTNPPNCKSKNENN